MTPNDIEALKLTEEILNALEAIRGRVGILDTNMSTVAEVFRDASHRVKYGDEVFVRRRRRRPAPRRGQAAKKPTARKKRSS